jgi:hypothetical protein
MFYVQGSPSYAYFYNISQTTYNTSFVKYYYPSPTPMAGFIAASSLVVYLFQNATLNLTGISVCNSTPAVVGVVGMSINYNRMALNPNGKKAFVWQPNGQVTGYHISNVTSTFSWIPTTSLGASNALS